MMEQDVEASNNIVIGTLFIFSKVLFDFGAIHSFVSVAFAYHAYRNIEPLECYLSIATSNGRKNNCELGL